MAIPRGVVYYNQNEAKINVVGAATNDQETFLITAADAGATNTTSTLKDLGGGPGQKIASSPEGGAISGEVIITPDAVDLYKELDVMRKAKTEFTMSIGVPRGTPTLTWTYTGCVVTQLGGATLDANGSGALTAPANIEYADRTLA